MPITKREQARESGFAQVRKALESFEGDVVSAEFGQWGGTLIDEDTGKPIPPKEFLEIINTNVKVLTVNEELSMAVDEWNFRVNCSDFKGSFWVEDFLASADKYKLLIPDDLTGKRITWVKATREWDIKGRAVSYSNFIIGGVKKIGATAPKVVRPISVDPLLTLEEEEVIASSIPSTDPIVIALALAVGKTETQFRSAIALHPAFVNSPLLPLAKAGAITKSLVEQGKLIEVQEGTKKVYRKPE